MKHRILIVDDEPLSVKSIVSCLRHDFITERACDGREAIEKLTTFEPDLVLLDIMMPNMDGLDSSGRSSD